MMFVTHVKMRAGVLALTTSAMAAAMLAQAFAVGPQRRAAARAAQPPAAPAQKIAAQMVCPSPLGIGVSTKVSFCDVMTESKPAPGIVVTLPPHKGPVILTFNLHNR